MNNLIVPIAADKKEYSQEIPYLFRLNDKGVMLCIEAIMGLGLGLEAINNIYFVILKKHSTQYMLREMFEIQFRRFGLASKAHVIELNNNTQSQPETIYQAIKNVNIEGSIMIKDADSYFTCEWPKENSVCIYPLDALDMVNPKDKSYVNVDDMYHITNIIEKRIIGRDFCSGGYYFEDTDVYCKYYEKIQNEHPLYMSHIVYSMLLDGYQFRPIKVTDYRDWGTENDWRRTNG